MTKISKHVKTEGRSTKIYRFHNKRTRVEGNQDLGFHAVQSTSWLFAQSPCGYCRGQLNLLLFITRKYTIINANLKFINAKSTFILFNRHSLAQIHNHLHQRAFHIINRRPLTPFYYTLGIINFQLRNRNILPN